MLNLGYLITVFLAEEIGDELREFVNECVKKTNFSETEMVRGLILPKFTGNLAKINKDSEFDRLIKIDRELKKITSFNSLENRQKVKNILNELEARKDFMSALMSAIVYYEIGNGARGNRIIRKLIRMELHSNTFYDEGENPRLKLGELYKSYFVKLDLMIKNKKILHSLLRKIMINGKGSLADFISSEFDVDLDESDVEEWIKSNIYGKPFAGAWIRYFIKSKSEIFIFDKLLKSNYFENLSDGNIEDLWILEHGINIPKAQQTKVRDLVIKLFDTGTLYYKDIFFRVMENANVKRLVSEKRPEFKKPLFALKRNFFLELLEKSIGVEYAIYNLLKMGDGDLTYLKYLNGK